MASPPSKRVVDVVTLQFNFANQTRFLETLTSPVVTVTVVSGFDPSPSSMLSGPPSLSGQVVSQKIAAGLPGVQYVVTCTVDSASTDAVYRDDKPLAVLSTLGSYAPSSLPVLSGVLPNGVVGAAYSAPLSISGGYMPYTPEGIIANAPTWMGFTVVDATLVCAGVPNEDVQTSYIFSPEIADAALNHASSPQNITITRVTISGDAPDGAVGQVYSYTYTFGNGTPPYTFDLPSGSIPAGTSLNVNTSEIAGTPTVPGLSSYNIRITDVNGITAILSDSINVEDINNLVVVGTDSFGGVPVPEWRFVFPYKQTTGFTLLTVDVEPASVGRGGGWSPDGDHYVYPHDASPFKTLYKRTSTGLQKIAQPTGAASLDIGWSVAWTPDSTRMAFGQRGNNPSAFPYIIVYARSGDTYSQVATINDFTTGLRNTQALSYSGDGTLLAIVTTQNPGLYLQSRSGDVYTNLVGFGSLPAGAGGDCSFSGQLLAYGYALGMRVYEAVGVALNTLYTFSIGTVSCVKWSPDGTYLAALGTGALGRPNITVFSRVGSVLTQVYTENLTDNGTTSGLSLNPQGIAFTPTRMLVGLSMESAAGIPNIRVYDLPSFAVNVGENITFPVPSAGEYRPVIRGMWGVQA